MEIIIINDDKLLDDDINKYKSKARAILIDNDKILISNYGGVILLPGGSIDNGETPDDAIIRELKEETGINYNISELQMFMVLKYYQYNYLTRDNELINRMITTHYYLGNYKGVNIDNAHRTEKEKKDNFNLELLSFDEIMQLLNTKSNNPRKEHFDREIREVVKVLKLTRK